MGCLITRIYQQPLFNIILSKVNRFLQHPLNLVIGKAIRWLNVHRMLTSGPLIASRHVQNSIGIDEKSHLYPRQARRLRFDRPQLKSRQAAAVFRQLSFALKDVNIDMGLIVHSGGKALGGTGGNSGISMYQPLHHPAHGLDTERERNDVEQQYVRLGPHQHSGLYRRSKRHDLVGINRAQRLTPKELPDPSPDQWSSSRPAHQHHLTDIIRGQVSICHCALATFNSSLDHWLGDPFKLIARELFCQPTVTELELYLDLIGCAEPLFGVFHDFQEFKWIDA